MKNGWIIGAVTVVVALVVYGFMKGNKAPDIEKDVQQVPDKKGAAKE